MSLGIALRVQFVPLWKVDQADAFGGHRPIADDRRLRDLGAAGNVYPLYWIRKRPGKALIAAFHASIRYS